MIDLTNRVFQFFNKDFKKRFIFFVSVPFILSALFCLDCFYFPTIKINDRISSVALITVSQSAGGTSATKSKRIGYKYSTEENYSFSTMSRRIKEANVILEISPVFKSVKSVIVADKKIEISSGFNGINLVLLVTCNLIISLSICYTLLAKNITQNAKMNLVFLNIFMFILWIIIIAKFGL